MLRGSVDIYMVYNFIRRLTTPFDETEAYRLGIIDSEGNFLKRRRELRTTEERNALGVFDILVFNLKKILSRVPGGRSRLATYAAALWLIKEGEDHADVNSTLLEEKIEEYISYLEETPTVNVGLGNIAGLGVGDKGEPGLTKAQQKKHRKRAKATGPIISKVLKRKKIEEAFDRPEPFKVEKRERHTFTASSKIDSDVIGFLATIVIAPDVWEVSFYANGSTDLTGSGNPIKVMSTVMGMMKIFLKEYDPEIVTFTGSREKGRVSLYDRMSKRFASQYGYKVSKKDIGNSVEFKLEKK